MKDNGFNPQWHQSFSFKSTFPSLAILRFVVMDADTLSDDFIGQYSLPLESLAPGVFVCGGWGGVGALRVYNVHALCTPVLQAPATLYCMLVWQ